jgi:uncharacterized membrane protein YqjE
MAIPVNKIEEQEQEPDLTGRSTPAVLTSLVSNVSEMVRTEVRLAKAEITEKADQAKSGAIGLFVGGGITLLGLIFILLAAIFGLTAATGLPLWASSLIVGGIIGIAGFIMLQSALSKLKPKNLEPEKTETALKRDAQLVKETMQ